MKKTIQKIVNSTPLANFGNVKVSYVDETQTMVQMHAFSPADACRLIEAIRQAGHKANGNPCDHTIVFATL